MRKLTFGEVKSFAQRDRKRLKHWTAGHRAGVTVQGAGHLVLVKLRGMRP